MPDFDENYEEFEGSQTYHRSYELPGDMDKEDLANFILENSRGEDEGFYLIAGYGGEEDYISTQEWYIDDYDGAFDELDEDLDSYGVDNVSSVTVVYRGYL